MMNENAMPNRASASIKPIPMNIVVRTWFAYSGCRAIASTDFPIKIPRPTPGPIAARPITKPFPIVLRPASVTAATRPCDTTPSIRTSLSMLFGQRAPYVGGGQYREDESLKDSDEDLEGNHQHGEREGDAQQDPGLGAVLEEEDRTEEKDREQEVARQEIGRETDRQGDGPDHDVRDELDHHHERIPQNPWCGGDDAGVLQVAEEP